MSQPVRPNQAGMPLQRPTTPATMMYSTSSAPYNMGAVPSFTAFAPPGASVYPPQMANAQGGFNLVTVPSNVQRMYVPVQQMPPGHAFIRPGVANPLIATDPAKMLEEQRRLEKERNFQMQQQRLKQFTVAGKKTGSTAEHLLESMFGRPDAKRTSKPIKNEEPGVQKSSAPSPSQLRSQKNNDTFLPSSSIISSQSDIGQAKQLCPSSKQKLQKDPKELENMMMKYSNLSGPQKAKTFQKPLVKDISRNIHSATKFLPSEKAVDWNHLSGLDNVFSIPKPRFPSWCRSENVPQLYHEVAKLVTNTETQALDTNRLHAIFVSSGLSQKLLAEIWEMVNKTLPGSLTVEEMYAALALIAVAQAGHQITCMDILHQLPSSPVPVLKCFTPPQAVTHEAPSSTMPSATTGVIPPMPMNTSPPVAGANDGARPTTLASVEKVRSNVTTWKPFLETGSKVPSLEEEFDEFKSATPMAVNIPPLSETVASSEAGEDDFDDFKQADPPFEAFKSTTSDFATFPPQQEQTKSSVSETTDLMSPEEDKYNIFRVLQESSVSTESVGKPLLSSIFDSVNKADKDRKASISAGSENQPALPNEDEFTEFLEADTKFPTIEQPSASVSSADFSANFADFSKLNNEKFSGPSVPSTSTQGVMVEDPEFGDFASFKIAPPFPDTLNQESAFRFSKDNISIAESQSVSSLEFGAFDTKSSLSRQGSIPSLDLKGVGLEMVDADDDNGDEFGDMQSAISTVAAPPSTSYADASKVTEEKSVVVPAPPVITGSLTDKYSVIRSHQVILEDQHVSDWTRCVQGCLEILQTATKIFNQMSCSSVCSEVLGTEEGKNYVKNVVEVYRVVRRISVAAKSYEKQNNKLQMLLEDADQAFHTFSVFLTGSPLMPSDASLDFSPGILKICSENNEVACGVCLLNVDSGSKAFNKQDDKNKLSYGGRQYHSPCANLWVNRVDPLLPMLTLPQLI